MSISKLAPSSPGDPGAGSSLPESSGGLLAEFAGSRHREAVEQVYQVRLALAFCAVNSPDPRHPAATVPGAEGQLSLAGQGAPGVAEFAVVEFGAVAGMSTNTARTYLGRCLELGHRLPHVWAATCDGQVPAWRALRIADHTMCLPLDGAAWVDTQVAPLAGRVGPVAMDRLVEEAIVRFDPETAAQRALEALETRHATITLDPALSSLGAGMIATGRLDAVLDAADALDLDTALADLAADLGAAGDTASLDIRRAKALGLLARGEAAALPEGTRPRHRQVVLHLHLPATALHRHAHGHHGGLATLHTDTGQPLGPVSLEQIRRWCAIPEAQVSLRPVLDLATSLRSTGYQPSARLRDQVIALNPVCAFPHCHRPSHRLDLDHITPHADGGETTTDNLAPLCRRHHRAKTHGGWTYHRLGPGKHVWTSPHGYRWITGTNGTRKIIGRSANPSTRPP